MDKKEVERLKEEEKEHLQKIRELKRRLRSAQGTLRVKEALREMENATDTSELDAAMEALTGESIEAEARLDVAMNVSGDEQADISLTPEELRQKKADDLVSQMKAALFPEETRRSAKETEPSADPDDKGENLPEKTIGKMKPENEPEDEPLPEKTIGRMGDTQRGEET